MKLKNIHWIVIITLSILYSACYTAGSHGYIKAYQYDVKKFELQGTIETVISKNNNLKKDDSIRYFNDGDNYVTLSIVSNNVTYKYIFRYYGSKSYWEKSKISEIFIAYAYDNIGKGGAIDDFSRDQQQLLENLLKTFETEFISKIDKEIGQIHTSPDL